MTLRSYAGECVDNRSVEGVRRRLIGCVTARDEGMLGASDEQLLERAIALSCVLVSEDHDMLRLAKARIASGAPFPGLIFIKPDARVGEVVRALVEIAEMLTPEDMVNRIEWIPLRGAQPIDVGCRQIQQIRPQRKLLHFQAR
ncbi:MAG TPA: DUF5615 family PIN-like protein [Polyangiaceae bacterium]|nr:DUF5615 family PIN-like protein [Polyangiaceae bacterium]